MASLLRPVIAFLLLDLSSAAVNQLAESTAAGTVTAAQECAAPLENELRSTTILKSGNDVGPFKRAALDRAVTVYDYTSLEGTYLKTCLEYHPQLTHDASPASLHPTDTLSSHHDDYGAVYVTLVIAAIFVLAYRAWYRRQAAAIAQANKDFMADDPIANKVADNDTTFVQVETMAPQASLRLRYQGQVHHLPVPRDIQWRPFAKRVCGLLGLRPNSLSHCTVGGDTAVCTDADLRAALQAPTVSMDVHTISKESKSHTAAPMAWPHLSQPSSALKKHYQYIVVGSGYGGGVSASRLCRAGEEVCVLERGQEKWPGEYPNKMDEFWPNLQLRGPVLPSILPQTGKRDAFFDFRVEEGSFVWVGCGLGGGSLVNSGVCIAPDQRLFQSECWPTEIRADADTKLKDGFDKAFAMLQPEQYLDQENRPLHRITRMSEAAEHLRANGYPQAVAKLATVNVSFKEHVNAGGVTQPACTLCGDCNSGCNIGAKNTVLMNYLPDAFNHGAQIFTKMHVDYVERSPSGKGWTVHCTQTGTGASKEDVVITCDTLILAAGTLGTTEILLRSRERGMRMSGQVGLHYGGDGDFFGFSYNGKMPVSTVGYGDDPAGNEAAEGDVGATITTVLDLRDDKADPRQGMILEDIGMPGIFASVVNTLMATGADTIGEVTDPDPADEVARIAREVESLEKGPYVSGGSTNHSLLVGGMSFDNQDGKMVLDKDELRIQWADPSAGPNPPDRVHKIIKTVCETPEHLGTFIPNPISKESRLTIHPFGGCILADDASKGGVNHKGQLFQEETGTDVYDDLYVLDGSTLPTSLGVNPLWTISALAERAVAIMIEDRVGGSQSHHSAGVDPPIKGVQLTRHLKQQKPKPSGHHKGAASLSW